MRFWYNPSFLAVAALLILSIPALKSLAIPNFYTSHDGETHTARIAQYYQAAKDGQIPPRLAGSLYYGLGSPIFVYIYPLPYLLGAGLHHIGFSYTDSFEIIMASAFIFSGLFAYLWLKEVFASPKAAFLGSLFYVWAPYRFLLMYVRGSISEMLAYTFLPLTLFALTKLAKLKNLKWLAVSALSLSLLLLSQNLVAAISLPVIITYMIILSFAQKSSKYFFLAIGAFGWAFAIAATSYLPTLLERQHVRFDEFISLAYDDHFVTFKQLIRSPWGYGFDLPGTVNDQMSFQIGIAHLLVLLCALGICSYYLLIKRSSAIVSPHHLVLSLFFLAVTTASIFLMIESRPTVLLWQNFKPLNFVDIPWRFLGLVTLSASFLTAQIAKAVKPGLFFLFLIALVLVANRNHLRINQTRILDDNFFQNYTGTATQYNEFTPKWRQITHHLDSFAQNKTVETISGQAEISDMEVNSNRVTFDAQVDSSSAQVIINKFYFPGWQVAVDSQKLTPFIDLIIPGPSRVRFDRDQDTSGLMLINLERGKHQITLQFQETPLRLFADYLSAGSLLLALGVVLKNVKK